MLDNIPNWIYMFVICYTEALKRNSTCGTTWYFRQLFSVLFIIFGNVVFPSSDEANKINKKKNASSSFVARMSRAPNGNIITYQCFDRVYNNDQTIHSRIVLFIFGVGVARPRWRLM